MSAPILVADAIGKRFGAFTALDDVSVAFAPGRLTAIIGPNGAGKSTFFSLLSGAVAPTSGRIRFEGADVAGLAPYRFARMGIARSYQITSLFPQLCAHENVRLACQAVHAPGRGGLWRSRARYPELADEADAALSLVGLSARRGRLAANLAHGEQRALEIAVALASRPKLLLLDEPTAGMSPEETKEMMDLIARLAAERTVLLVEHKMKMVMGLADHIVVLHQGRLLAAGTPDAIRADANVRRVYLGEGRSGRG
jgi:branched-chain amino acid transport system ATP-binding protein